MEYAGMVQLPELRSDEVVEITTKKKKHEAYPGYTILGNGKATRKGGQSMDILNICKELNRAEMNLLQFIRDELEHNKMRKEKNVNLVTPSRSEEWTVYLKTALKKNYPHMECLRIIQRVKRGTYMINPYLFIPPYDVDFHKEVWDKLESECTE